jgi:hypothetical protein
MGLQLPFWCGVLPWTGSKPGQQRFFAGEDFLAIGMSGMRLLRGKPMPARYASFQQRYKLKGSFSTMNNNCFSGGTMMA